MKIIQEGDDMMEAIWRHQRRNRQQLDRMPPDVRAQMSPEEVTRFLWFGPLSQPAIEINDRSAKIKELFVETETGSENRLSPEERRLISAGMSLPRDRNLSKADSRQVDSWLGVRIVLAFMALVVVGLLIFA